MSIGTRALVGAVALTVATPALADKYFAVTPSGATEMLFPEKPQEAIGKLSSQCIDRRMTVISSSTSEVVCESPLNMGQSIAGQLLMGNSYSTPPRRFFKFNVAEVNGISRVQAAGWMELQMAFGQTKRNDFTGPPFHNNAMQFMANAGGQFPSGTTFPNHVAMGFDPEPTPTPIGKYAGFRVKTVKPGQPGEKAGLQVGDVVAQIAGKRFKSMDDYLDATAKAAKDQTYEVEVLRGDQTLKLTVERAFRPTWTEQVLPVAAAVAAPVASSSIADELSKLAKLKAEGLLTEAEFEAQKKKLLEQ